MKPHQLIAEFTAVVCVATMAFGAAPARAAEQGAPAPGLQVPRALEFEHQELHAQLAKATKAGGKTGEAARAVAKVLHPHFIKEEEFALPPLGLLPALAAGTATPDMSNVIAMTDKLKADLPQMLAEHKAIVGALRNLTAAAKAEKRPEYVRFAEQLQLHAQTEEQVLYPAAILVGEYVKLRLGKTQGGVAQVTRPQ